MVPKQTPLDWEDLTGGLPSGSDPISQEIDRYAQLPRHTRLFLERADEEDIRLLVTGLRGIRLSIAGYRLLKRLVLWAAGVFIATVAFGDKMAETWAKFAAWFRH